MHRFANLTIGIAGLLFGYLFSKAAFSPASPFTVIHSVRISADDASHPRIIISSTRTDHLLAALEIHNPLERDASLYHAIEEMDAGDFAALAADIPALAKRFEKVPAETRDAMLHAAFERWFSLDPKAPLQWFTVMHRLLPSKEFAKLGINRDAIITVTDVFSRYAPEWVAEQICQDGFGKELPDCLSSALQQITHDNAQRGKQLLDRLNPDGRNINAISSWASGLVHSDPVALARFAADSHCPIGTGNTLLFASNEVAALGPVKAAEFLAQLKDTPNYAHCAWDIATAFARDTKTDPLAFLSEQASIDPAVLDFGIQSSAWLPGDLTAMMKPERMAEWAINLPQAYRVAMLDKVLSSWELWDSAAVADWAAHQEEGHAASPGPDQSDNDSGKSVIAAAKEHVGLLSATRAAQGSDLKSAFQICQSIGSNALASEETMGLVSTLAREDTEATTTWLQSLPSGPGRDRAWFDMAGFLAYKGDKAAPWVEGIADPGLKQRRAEDVFNKWNLQDPAKARAWISNLPNVNEQWRARFLRMHP